MPVSRFRTDMNAPILRYADVLLMHAEAAAKNGNLDDAVVSLNKVRARARSFGNSLDASSYGAAPADIVSTPSQEELLDIIFGIVLKSCVLKVTQDLIWLELVKIVLWKS